MDFNTTLSNTTDTGGNGTIPFTLPPMNYFGYDPNKSLEFAVVILFAVATIIIFIENAWKKTWFMSALFVGGLMEVIAFAAMIYTTNNMTSLDGYIVYLVCVLVAPTVLAAGCYALAGHVMIRGEARVACFTPGVTKYCFLICDIVAFFTQGIGGTVVGSAKTLAQIKLGANIVLAGLAISLSVFIVFLCFSIVLHRRILRNLHNKGCTDDEMKWTRIFWVIYLNMVVLAIRGFYRVAEFQQKLATPPSNTLSTQAYFYGFDSFLMLILMISWCIFHPSRFGMHKKHEDLSIPMSTKKVDIRGVQN